MTNFERIKNMSDKQFAKFINDVAVCCFKNADCGKCPINCRRSAVYCNTEIIGKWLKSEARE